MAMTQQSAQLSAKTLLPFETKKEVKYIHLAQACGLIGEPNKAELSRRILSVPLGPCKRRLLNARVMGDC